MLRHVRISCLGVKTKAIEAIAMNTTVVSTTLGAMGINREVCGTKLKVVQDGDWKMFAEWIMTADNDSSDTPIAFFDYYYWGNIVDQALQFLENKS